MRYLKILCGLVIAISSCNNSSTDADTAAGDTTYLPTEVVTTAAEVPVRINNLIWSASYDTANQHVVLKQQRKVNPDTLTAEKIINEINNSWDDVKLEYKKISHDTIYVAIPQSNTLTQGMGSSGAYNYMSSTTFSLTELKNVRFVNFDFVEGDHMAPGTMKRADFKQ
ncbi:MAG: hypothetical protein Q7T76_03960 [Ferruginibacter sp.]|nr:hypothetical protein [Ferruginibacter sp.]